MEEKVHKKMVEKKQEGKSEKANIIKTRNLMIEKEEDQKT